MYHVGKQKKLRVDWQRRTLIQFSKNVNVGEHLCTEIVLVIYLKAEGDVIHCRLELNGTGNITWTGEACSTYE